LICEMSNVMIGPVTFLKDVDQGSKPTPN
jgi:hypothetical protein